MSLAPALAAFAAPASLRVAFVAPADLPLYPLRMMNRDMLSIMDLVYESVLVIGDDRRPQPKLATSWETRADGKTWVFHLREGVLFHDGRELTAYDVAATMDAIKEIAEDQSIPDNEKGQFFLLPNYCSSWNADDAYTLTVQTKRPYYGLLYCMTFPVLQAQSLWQENPPGTGPYRVSLYQPGSEIWLTGNQAWYGPPPHVSEITGVWHENDEAALAAFEAETVDIVMTRSMSSTRYRGTASMRADSYAYATQQVECLLMNYYRELRKPEIRQAVAYAIDKSRLVTNVYQNLVTPTDSLAAPGTWLYNAEAATYNHNPERAAALLDGAGWDTFNDRGYRITRNDMGETQELSLRLAYYEEVGSSLRANAAGEIAAMMRSIGIRVYVSAYSFADGSGKLLNRDYDLFLCAYNMDRVPDPNFILLPTGYGNYVYYRSDEMKGLCEGLRKAYEPADFQQAWMAIQALMAQDLPFLPLYWRQGIVLTRYPYSNIRDIREFELLRGIEQYR